MANKNKYKLNFTTQYNQFYVVDKNSVTDLRSLELWTDTSVVERLGVDEGTIGVYTECYGPVKGEFSILDGPRVNVDYDKYDHIVEGVIEVKSGVIQVQDCPNSSVELEIKVHPGKYKLRVYSSNLRSVEGDEGDDYYELEIWPENTNIKRVVLKQYNP